MPWTKKRFVVLASAVSLVISILVVYYGGEKELRAVIDKGFKGAGSLWGLFPQTIGPIPLGWLIWGLVAIAAIFLIFYSPRGTMASRGKQRPAQQVSAASKALAVEQAVLSPRDAKWLRKMRKVELKRARTDLRLAQAKAKGEQAEQARRAMAAREAARAEQEKIAKWAAEERASVAKALGELQAGARAAGAVNQRAAREVIEFSDAEIVNAPAEKVWGVLKETNCGPTCEGLLEDIRVTGTKEDFLSWSGNGRILDKEILVEGTTRCAAPTKLEVACTSGAMKGFQCTYEVEGKGDQTKVREEARFDARKVPEEFSDLTGELSALVEHTLRSDLRRLKEKVERPVASPSHLPYPPPPGTTPGQAFGESTGRLPRPGSDTKATPDRKSP